MAKSPTIRFPTVGLALGTGLLVAECVVWVKGTLDSFGGAGVGAALLQSLALYVGVGVGLDLLVQVAAPRRWRGSLVARGLPTVVVAFATHYAFGVAGMLAYATIPVAVAWTCAVHVRWGIPVAVGMAVFGLAPGLPSFGVVTRAAQAERAEGDGPSFVVVILDTLRWDHSSLSGYERDTTPHLAALADRGVSFERAYASSCWSIPSHASLFTGLLPRHHGATFESFRLPDGSATLASVLGGLGYETVGFSANPYIASGTGMSQGFRRFDDLWRPAVMRRMLVSMQVMARLSGGNRDKGGADVVEAFGKWYREREPGHPFFAFVNIMEAHAPYQDAPLKAEFADSALSDGQLERIGDVSHEAQWFGSRVPQSEMQATWDLLDGASASADSYLGEILELVGDDAVVVVLSDHGDLVGEYDLYGHMTSLYEILIRIPMVMAGPGVPSGVVVEDPVSIVDVMPTLLAMAGADPRTTDGVELGPVISGELSLADRVVQAEHFRTDRATQLWVQNRSASEMRSIRARRRAVIGSQFKRVVAQDGTDFGYDLTVDPHEERPIAGAATGYEASVPQPVEIEGGEAELDPAQLEALRSLGYVH